MAPAGGAELGLLAQKSMWHEELDRFDTHIKPNTASNSAARVAMGPALRLSHAEFNREANTLGSKGDRQPQHHRPRCDLKSNIEQDAPMQVTEYRK